MSEALPRVLLVDDEPLVLEGLSRQLAWDFDVSTATSGQAALALVQQRAPFAVIVSDMRMPNMDGAELLERCRALDAHMVRVLLTGQSDLAQAIRAVNHGQLFRFLSKPCPQELLKSTLQAAVRQHQLLTAETELLERTLRGSIKTLVDTLALASPRAFGHAQFVERIACELMDELGLEDRWPVQVAALLSNLAVVTVPADTVERYFSGARLSQDESELIARMPEMAAQLLAAIPRLDPAREILRARGGGGPNLPPGAQVLRVAYDLTLLLERGIAVSAAINQLRLKPDDYDPRLLALLGQLPSTQETGQTTCEMKLNQVRTGMVLVSDVRAKNGMIIVTAGHEITTTLLQRLHNFASGMGVTEPLVVSVPRHLSSARPAAVA